MGNLNGFNACPLPKRSTVHAVTAPATLAPAESCPLPSRGSIRDADQKPPKRRSVSRWAFVGAGASAVALAGPVVGFASASQNGLATEKSLGTFAGGETWGAGEELYPSLPSESELNAVAAAASRAKVRTPIEVSSCVAADQSADGARGITQRFQAVWPLQEGSYTETSSFSWRVSPISGQMLMHEGVDWAAAAGTPIVAVAPGTVTEIGYNDRSGNYLEITHELSDGTTFTSLYMHQDGGAIIVADGQTVEAGQQIGAVGSTGWSTGPHLHFEVRDASGQPVDPHVWMQNLDAVFPGQICS